MPRKKLMLARRGIVALAVTALVPLSGCRDNAPPPPRVAVRPIGELGAMGRESVKPLPSPQPMSQVPPPPFDDVPLVDQRPPEQGAFVDAYRRVGSPRITLFVNRTLEGSIVPVNSREPLLSVERTRSSSTGVTVESGSSSHVRDENYWGRYNADDNRNTKFQSTGPGEYRESAKIYLEPGQYDEAAAKSLDYEAVETIMTDWMAAGGQVTVVSPTMARQRLNDTQVKELQSGRPQALSEVAQQLDADVLIQVQARPTRQTREGLEVRIIAEAINTRGGQSVARAVVDVPPPLEKTQINKYTRYLARRLMDGMIGTWNSPPPADRRKPEAQQPAPSVPEPASLAPQGPSTGPTNWNFGGPATSWGQ